MLQLWRQAIMVAARMKRLPDLLASPRQPAAPRRQPRSVSERCRCGLKPRHEYAFRHVPMLIRLWSMDGSNWGSIHLFS